ncbi:MAG: alkaline phosphatase family protein [Acidobacteriota bacterium]|nr:alkaline phosphatase family protein [Acidobacteriota bacterium]
MLFPHSSVFAQAKRIIIIKADGLSYNHIERSVAERNPQTCESLLPAIKRVFYDGGTRLQNFYVRGISLSAPSWWLLDTGQHLQIKGNVEYDRFTLRTYDYLNFFPFYMGYLRSKQADKVGTEVLDDLGVPLLIDAFDYQRRYQSYQLFQRGARWTTMLEAPRAYFAGRSARDIAGEWAAGVDFRGALTEQYECDVVERLSDSNIAYLDIFTAEFDHAAHLHHDRATLLRALQNTDAIVGRVWQAIERSPLRDETVLVLLSDHSMNTDERVYSQGYDLVRVLNSAAGGGHHVVTNRHPLSRYQFKGFNPLVNIVVTASDESFYLKGESSKYPTALLDLDGNERASVHLRNSQLNTLHILLQQLKRKELKGEPRDAATARFFVTLDRNRARWLKTLAELQQELDALRRFMARGQAMQTAQPQKWSKGDEDAGRDKEARRAVAQLNRARTDEEAYAGYARTLARLLALRREGFDPKKLKIEDVIAPRAMGEPNTIHDLQNYVVGLNRMGNVSDLPFHNEHDGEGSDHSRSTYCSVNYFALLSALKVRNNVQPTVDSHPVDFIAVRVPHEAIASQLQPEEQTSQDAVWVYGSEARQALILSRRAENGELLLHYLPVAGLTPDASGQVHFKRIAWQAGLPLKMWEDRGLRISGNQDEGGDEWLNQWHTEVEWLRAIHQTKYSNALIGLHEHLMLHDPPQFKSNNLADDSLLRQFHLRQRRLVEADLLVLANDHWNFNLRDFNPGGNHGSFFRASTRSTLMLAGGAHTGVPRARLIEEPYDSLSLAPTIFALLGQLPNGHPSEQLRQRGFRNFPGRAIREVISP